MLFSFAGALQIREVPVVVQVRIKMSSIASTAATFVKVGKGQLTFSCFNAVKASVFKQRDQV